MMLTLTPEQATARLKEYSVEFTPSKGYLRAAAGRIERSGVSWDTESGAEPPSDLLDAVALVAYRSEDPRQETASVSREGVGRASVQYAHPKRSDLTLLIEDLLAPYGGSLAANLA